MSTECTDLTEELERLTLGVLVVSSDARVLGMNSTASRLAAEGRGLSVGPEGIRAPCSDDTIVLRRLVAAASRNGARTGLYSGGILRLSSAGGRPAFEVLVAPFRAVNSAGLPRQGAAVIYIIDTTIASGAGGSGFAQVHGLTPAETKVASLIARGHNGRQAAEQLGVSYNTIKTHLRQIFAKTGASRQGGLIRLMMSAPAPGGPLHWGS